MASKTRGQSWFVAIAFPYCSLRPRTDAAAMPMSPTSAITSKSVDTIDGRRRFHVVRLRVRPLAIFVLSRILLFVMAFSKVGLSRTIQFSFFFRSFGWPTAASFLLVPPSIHHAPTQGECRVLIAPLISDFFTIPDW